MRTTVRQNDPASCTGCGACVSICPKHAITMRADSEGFVYPVVDGTKCVACDACKKRCPAGKPAQRSTPSCLRTGKG
ncbi:MAG: 4Fe-4S dicluster domain-containing protein [Christensenellales bacterium]